MSFQSNPLRASIVITLLIILTFAVFSIWPMIDLWVSDLGYDATAGFWIDEVPLSSQVRHAIWNGSTAMVIVAVVGLSWRTIRKRASIIPARVWAFILLLYIIGPGLIVNVLLKEHWGRARPATIIEFGGTLQFTPPIQITDQCLTNCSFVSGEASAAMALCLSLLMILHHLRPLIGSVAFRTGQGIAVLIVGLASAQRIATGRHFLSDTILAILLVLLIATALRVLLKIPAAPRQMLARGAVDNPGDSPYTPPT